MCPAACWLPDALLARDTAYQRGLAHLDSTSSSSRAYADGGPFGIVVHARGREVLTLERSLLPVAAPDEEQPLVITSFSKVEDR